LKILAEIVGNVSLFGGLGLLTYGGHLAWSPLGYMIPGLALFALGLAAELR